MPRSKPAFGRTAEEMVAEARAAAAPPTAQAHTAELSLDRLDRAVMIPRDQIKEMTAQPRSAIVADEALYALARSIAVDGLLQPLLARPDLRTPGTYILIAGHRRLAAANLLAADAVDLLADDEDDIPAADRGAVQAQRRLDARARVRDLPALLRDVDEDTAYALALVENLQRQNLSAGDVMQAVIALQTRFNWSLRRIALHTHRDAGGLSKLTRVPERPALAALVHENLISAWTASDFVSLSDDDLAPFVDRIRAGDIRSKVQAGEALKQWREDRRRVHSPVTNTTDPRPTATESATSDAVHDGVLTNQHPIVDSATNAAAPAADPPTNDASPIGDDSDSQVLINQHPHRDGTPSDHPRLATAERGEDMPARPAARVGEGDVIHVESYDRRAPGTGRSNVDREAERLFSDVITFLAPNPVLDEGSLGKAITMIEATRDYLARHGRSDL